MKAHRSIVVPFAVLISVACCAQGPKVKLAEVMRMPRDSQELLFATLERDGHLGAHALLLELRSGPEHTGAILGLLMNCLPLPDDVWDELQGLLQTCSEEWRADISQLLMASSFASGDAATAAVSVGLPRARLQGLADGERERALARARRLKDFLLDINTVSLQDADDKIAAALRCYRTSDALELTSRLLARREAVADGVIVALTEVLMSRARIGVELEESRRLLWSARLLQSRSLKRETVLVCSAYLACNGDYADRIRSHSVLRLCSEGFDAAVPFAKACIGDCSASDSRVIEWLTTISMHGRSARLLADELALLGRTGPPQVKQLATVLSRLDGP